MKPVWKVIVGLAVVVPLGAYVAGSLAASASSDPTPRQTIEIRQADPTPPSTPTPTRTPTPSSSPTESGDDDSDDVEVVTPWDDLDDDHGGDRDGRDDDHSGHGRGGDGSHGGDDHDDSGHGGGED